MIHSLEIAVKPELLNSPEKLYTFVADKLSLSTEQINHVEILKRSIDARNRNVLFRLKVNVYTLQSQYQPAVSISEYKNVTHSPEVIIVGAGPAGLFAALRALELGFKPIILERGKSVQERKHDIVQITRNKIVNPNSNWCFGEGGAGTYSDGKLYTRSNKRGSVQEILLKFVEHGANKDILFDAHAHIGTDKLPAVIANIRNTIIEHGGIYRFNTCVSDFIIKDNCIKGVTDTAGNSYEGIAVILATGHSARDIYELFGMNKWHLEAKSFAVGVRVEHPQALINSIQYHSNKPLPFLPPATYSLAAQINQKGVFSFCMCPGGIIVPAATDKNQLVLNGMSNSMRNSPFANAGIVVQVSPSDIPQYQKYGIFALLQFQKELEEKTFSATNGSLSAPTQRLTDFVEKKISNHLNESSYLCGYTSFPLHELLPKAITFPLQQAFVQFDKKMRGFYTNQANVLGIESRTSSPVRIPRNDNFQHVQIQNLYPCGEGAGYAGGIVSSAIDGINCMNKIAEKD